MKKIILTMCCFVLLSCSQERLFVSYQGWYDDKTYVYNWSEVTTDTIRNGADLKYLALWLAKHNGYKQVVILHYQRFEQ